VKWYRTTKAHNSVIIDGVTEAATSSDQLWVPRRETPNRITTWKPGDDISFLTMVSPPEELTNMSVRWSRTITLVKDSMAVITDTFESDGEHTYEILLHFPPGEVTVSPKRTALAVRSATTAKVVSAATEPAGAFSLSRGMISVKGITTEAPVASFILKGRGNVRSNLLVIPSQAGDGGPKAKIKNKNGTTLVTLKTNDNSVTRIAITEEGISLV
jgi:hypothetical protein